MLSQEGRTIDIGDVMLHFLHDTLDKESHIDLLSGFDTICGMKASKLTKNLCGLKYSSKSWNEKL